MTAPTPLMKTLGFDSVEAYQEFYGLVPDGQMDGLTRRSLEIPRFCSVPDVQPVGEGLPRWGKSVLKYAITGQLPGIDSAAVKQAFQVAWDRWAAVCDIQASHISGPNEVMDIVHGTGKIDGPSSTLAYSGLPGNGTLTRINQLYDIDEKWIIADRVPVGFWIDLTRVGGHEVGHALGISHLGPGNLMASMYSSEIFVPQLGDIVEGVKRYGQPRVAPPPTQPPPTGANVWVKMLLPAGSVKVEAA